MSQLATISIRYVVRLLELAERQGAVPAELLNAAEMQPIVDDAPDVRVPTEQYYRLWGVTMAQLRDPSFPLRLVEQMDTASFDALGFAVVTSATFGEAFGRIRRYLPFATDGATWGLEYEGDVAALTFEQHTARTPDHRFVDEFSLAHLVIVGRKLTTVSWDVHDVRFQHAAPPDRTALEQFFRAPIVFGASRTELRLLRSVLDLPFPKADARMAAFFDRHIEAVLRRTHTTNEFITSVRRLLAASLMHNAYSLDDLARELAVSPRTLRRRLVGEGVTYSSLLDDVRRELAEGYLRDRRMSLGEIAFALGYSESATFHRAFRRWYDMTPIEYREAHYPAGPETR